MRYQVGNFSLTGAPFLDTILLGILIGAAAQGIISALGGKMPGPGMVFAGVAGGLIGVAVYLFQSALNV